MTRRMVCSMVRGASVVFSALVARHGVARSMSVAAIAAVLRRGLCMGAGCFFVIAIGGSSANSVPGEKKGGANGTYKSYGRYGF